MSVQKISISSFVADRPDVPVIDVRSPGEYLHAHIPGAINIPLFTDEERKEIGTLYKQQGKQKAIKRGLDFFGLNMRSHVEALEAYFKKNKINHQQIIVHCWRGGMRSAAMAWLFDLYGFDVRLIVGGYKAFRSWVLQQFQQEYRIKILGGYTGSAKTEVLHEMKNAGHSIIDLEGLAGHKGSAFGGIGRIEQPTQEMFENNLSLELHAQSKAPSSYFWLEDESQRIGRINIPHSLWQQIRRSPLYFMEIPFEERLLFISTHYGKLNQDQLVEATTRIQKRLGPNETKNTIQFLKEGNTEAAFNLLLRYYDKTYTKAMYQREDLASLLYRVEPPSLDILSRAKAVIDKIKSQQ
jgi:tRNA 2-selenouridine synthase